MTVAQFWEDFYRDGSRWSGNVNELLVRRSAASHPVVHSSTPAG